MTPFLSDFNIWAGAIMHKKTKAAKIYLEKKKFELNS